MNNNRPLAIVLAIVGVICLGAATFFATVPTTFLASSGGVHYKHALLFAGLAILCGIGANIARKPGTSVV